jgi:hypothetical protein
MFCSFKNTATVNMHLLKIKHKIYTPYSVASFLYFSVGSITIFEYLASMTDARQYFSFL